MPGCLVATFRALVEENIKSNVEKIVCLQGHQENVRVIFGIFISRNRIFGHFVFVEAVFQDLCLWIWIFGI